MKYILLMYAEEGAWPPEEHQAAIKESVALCHQLHAEGRYFGASPLHPPATAKCLKVRGGQHLITDGPFAESKEQLGGYFIVEADSIEEAIAVAAKAPGSHRGIAEIRPLMELSGLPDTGQSARAVPIKAAKPMRIAGWIMCILVTAFLLFSASGKFVEWEGKATMLERMGFSNELMTQIGILEVVLAVLLLVPRAQFLAAVLLTGYLGGATVTHLRLGDPIYFPVLVGVFMWIGVALRRPQIFSLALGHRQLQTK